MEDWKKSEGTFNLVCDPQRASGMMQNTCVKIERVTKRFGEDIVLQEVNLSLKTGNVYGIVGNNGSGKTVLMKCICGFLPVKCKSFNLEGLHYFCIWKKNRP